MDAALTLSLKDLVLGSTRRPVVKLFIAAVSQNSWALAYVLMPPPNLWAIIIQ